MFIASITVMLHFKRILKNRPVVVSLHMLAWVCFLFFPFFIYRIQILHKTFFIKELIDNLFLIAIFYLNIYVLIPRYFNRQKIVKYLSTVILLVVFITIQQAALDFYFFRNYIGRPAMMAMRLDKARLANDVTTRAFPPFNHRYEMKDEEGVQLTASSMATPLGSAGRHITVMAKPVMSTLPLPPPRWFRVVEGNVSFWDYLLFPEVLRRSGFFALLILFMSGFIKIAVEWFESEKQREALKVEKLNAELKFLKSQINPHFLFNCLNTIYSLAHKQSGQTEHAILKLSTIMRYMIYESNEDKVQLEHELKYLQDYIDIQRLRLPQDIDIQYELKGSASGFLIEPMLLVPFVENAFKHGISYAEESFISIDITIAENMIRLIVRNSLFKERVSERGGIGLQNVQKRLDMLYHGDHDITITETDNQFIVDLKIVLKK
ncbi:sensor histidine kinase [Chitinophaga varians]|uniref:sensor histidine kinase n=1 Tax=Chitinophaga varians TaxID=2202339 RepID=UPI00165F68E4|nr:histidine kinase [Chitinophaga varians]MBC9912290.1 histidine kinase [Chitinophaga varians]